MIDTFLLIKRSFKAVNSVELRSNISAFITISLTPIITVTILILSALIPAAFAISDSISV